MAGHKNNDKDNREQGTGEGGEKQTKFAAGHVNAIKTLPLCHAPSFARTPIDQSC